MTWSPPISNQPTTQRTPAYEFALAAAAHAANTRAEEVVLLDLRGKSPVTEFFIIATGTSPRQMRTVVDELQDLGKKMGFAAWKTSGYESARWIVLDCVNVVVHVFDIDSRDFYDLELLWGDSPRIDWRKELGLPPEPERPARERFAHAAGMDDMDAEEEEARLEGRDVESEEGDADVDEDAETDAPIVTELPDLSTGSNSVEFVEIDPPSKRRQRGRAVYPTPLEEEEDTTAEERSMGPVRSLGGADQSLDEDDQQRAAEREADGDPEAVSKEDLPLSRQRRRPMGGVSASLSSTSIGDTDEEDQDRSRDSDDREQDHRDEIPEAHEAAAEAVRMGDVELTTEQPGQRARRKALRTRADERGPTQAAPGPVNPKKAKAGIVKAAAKKKPAKKAAPKAKAKPKPAPRKKPAVKKAAAKPVKKKAAPKKKGKK
ncbi:MAG TPA: ribosome silencing factor [Phycisphaerae bacterium]|nr:ribosome silencing factor [Phycisphaerae bacterium]